MGVSARIVALLLMISAASAGPARATDNAASAALKQREAALQQRESALGLRETALQQREGAIQQREGAVQQREGALQQREGPLQLREGALQQRESSLSQRESAVQQRESAIQQRETPLLQRESTLRQRESAVEQKEKLLEEEEEEAEPEEVEDVSTEKEEEVVTEKQPPKPKASSSKNGHSRIRRSYNAMSRNIRDQSAEESEFLPAVIAAPRGRVSAPDASASAEADHSVELEGDAQNLFPSFANLFEPRSNNFRLGFNNQETAYSQRPNSYRSLLNYPVFNGFRNFEGFGKHENQASAPLVEASSSVLGSGNFGIIRGGTFNAQNDEEDYDGYDSFYNNGHGRPSLGVGYIANPRPNYNQDQFANFRDFADINAPSNSAYSHFVVVYANKNATVDEVSEESRRVAEPKNIFETLARLEEKPQKISRSKAKLQLTKQKMQNKKDQWKKANSKFLSKHDPEEPLLALS